MTSQKYLGPPQHSGLVAQMLDGKWPIMVQPFEDELFSSWLFRIALANGQAPRIFARLTYGSPQYWNMDLDVNRIKDFHDSFSNKTYLTSAQLEKLMMHNLLERLSAGKTDKTHLRWLIPLNNRLRNVNQVSGIPFCPLCLEENGYFKQSWRLATTTICLQHMIPLKEFCQRCHKPVFLKSIHQIFKNNLCPEAILFCTNCGFDLRRSFKHKAKSHSIQHNFNNTKIITEGFLNRGDLKISYSHLYFEAVSVLCCILLFRKGGRKLYRHLTQRLGLNYQRWDLVNKKMSKIESCPLNTRDIALYMIDYMLQNFPHRFLDTIDGSKMMQSYLHMARDYQPYWYYEINHLLNRKFK